MNRYSNFHTMMTALIQFHDIYQRPWEMNPKADLSEDAVRTRHRLMEEENNEYLEAALKRDIIGIADALGDKLYILLGTIISHGLQDKIVEIFEEIHKSNLTKLGVDGKPIYREDGKVIKGPNYTPPNLKSILEK